MQRHGPSLRASLRARTHALQRSKYDHVLAYLPPAAHRRCKSTASLSDGGPMFMFDIDGVLKIGEKVLPQGQEALRILNGDNKLNRKFPFILLTNGGGITEEERCYKLSRELGVEISIQQLIQAHTVFREQVKQFKDKPILVVGGKGNSCREVAHSYGFQKVYIPQDLLSWRPELWPFKKISKKEKKFVHTIDFGQVPFSAIFVFHDSRDWGFDSQIMTDLLMSPDGVVREWRDPEADWEQQIPVFFSNPDLLWGNDWKEPRFGQGAFQESFRALWRRTTGKELQATTGGKPTALTYQHAEKMLLAQANHPDFVGDSAAKLEKLGPTFMIGDNPYSDIAGGNAYGLSTILVRTGVFRGANNHPVHAATTVEADVLAGVKWALRTTLGDTVV